MKKIHFICKKAFCVLLIYGIIICSTCGTVSVFAMSANPPISDLVYGADFTDTAKLSNQFKDLSGSLHPSGRSKVKEIPEPVPTDIPKSTVTPTPTITPIPTATPTPIGTPTPTVTPTPVPVEIPKELQEFADNYPETADFVAEYPEKNQLHPEIDLSEEAKSEDVPLLIQWDERWGYEAFGSSFIGCSGCGPTSFSMVAVYLTHNPEYSPLYMANYVDEHGYHVKGVGTSWSFFTQGCEAFGIHCTSLSVNEAKIKEYLDKGSPIICSVGPGDFTVKGHLIVITGYDKKGLKINDPNSRINSEKSWDFSSIKSQIRSVWAFSAA